MNTSKGALAEIRLEHQYFNFVKNGDHVLCSITQKIIPIEELKYWNVDLQEVYASPEVALKRSKEINEV